MSQKLRKKFIKICQSRSPSKMIWQANQGIEIGVSNNKISVEKNDQYPTSETYCFNIKKSKKYIGYR